MRWTLELFNLKVLILLAILVTFLALSLMLLFMEKRLRKRKEERFTRRVEDTRLVKLKEDLKKTQAPREKLKVIDSHAKSLIKERHNIDRRLSYSELIPLLKQKKAYEYSSFCQKMFNAYYTKKEIKDSLIKDLLRNLTHLIRETHVYLDPENYEPDRLLRTKDKSEEKEDDGAFDKKKAKRLLEKKNRSLIDKKNLLKEREKMIKQKEKELAKKEKSNKKLLGELEKKIAEHEKRIKRQEELRKSMQQGLDEERKKKKPLTQFNKKKDLPQKEVKEEKEESPEGYDWRDEISVDTMKGKDWLKKRKKRK